MKSAVFDVTSVRLKLRHMVENNYVTIEQLDEPSPGFKNNMKISPQHFPNGYHGVRFKNLLRDS